MTRASKQKQRIRMLDSKSMLITRRTQI